MSTTIITISNPRPIKIFAFLLCTFSVFLMIVAISASDWMNSGGWREGLFEQCVKDGTPTPLPFEMKSEPGCTQGRCTGYIIATAILSIACVVTDLLGVVLTGLGLKSAHPRKKYTHYKTASISLTIALISILAAVILYPILFYKDLKTGNNNPALDGMTVTKTLPKPIEDANNTTLDLGELDNTVDLVGEIQPERNKENDNSVGSGDETTPVEPQVDSDGLILDGENEDSDDNSAVECNRDNGTGECKEDQNSLKSRSIQDFSFGFGYYFALVSAIFLLVAVPIILCDQKKEEIYYKEISVVLADEENVKE